jgi:hypothetical protein
MQRIQGLGRPAARTPETNQHQLLVLRDLKATEDQESALWSPLGGPNAIPAYVRAIEAVEQMVPKTDEKSLVQFRWRGFVYGD